ncbi:uncharacterized protein N7482_010181 [Penicillium canariense]|uniref:Transcription factor TFIIIC triple barrel domain-containing protein n=1 Tax=Penicillium canariense TaxID=189055 RepID=A0A9W9HNM2_9EURO|nr:uncharacterized protein N7482_010181 [Penicillium canariense]KAJ5150929.1 hypothetical protein N7482_010181 [Penicillium canariense]
MDQPMDAEEDEWEYEYHESETESFYLNLDLSSIHGPMRPPRRRQQQEGITSPHQEEDLPATGDPHEASAASEAFTPLESTEPETLSSERIQILGLHTCNPIVSYYNQIFSCSWADQIGTELIFSHPDTHPDTDTDTDHPDTHPLLQGPSFELLAANSVKLLGRKANITSSSGSGLADPTTSTSAVTPVPTDNTLSSQPGAASVPRRAAQPSHQSHFLARLQSIKAAKGETDTVRTTFSMRRNVNVAERLGAWARTEAQLAEIHALTQRANKGDPEAIAALEQMMRDFAQQESLVDPQLLS